MARNGGDVQDSWFSVASIITQYGENKDDFASVAGPGFFNDPDMVGFALSNCYRVDRIEPEVETEARFGMVPFCLSSQLSNFGN